MNKHSHLTALLIAFVLAWVTSHRSFSAESAKPNVILILVDDLGYECVGANGGTSYKTPVI